MKLLIVTVLLYIFAFLSLSKILLLLESHATEKKQLVNEIVSLKKGKDSYERQSSRREIHVKQVQNEAHRGLDALHDSEEKIQTLRNQASILL